MEHQEIRDRLARIHDFVESLKPRVETLPRISLLVEQHERELQQIRRTFHGSNGTGIATQVVLLQKELHDTRACIERRNKADADREKSDRAFRRQLALALFAAICSLFVSLALAVFLS